MSMVEWQMIQKSEVASRVSLRLQELLEHGKVTWFVSGGSNIAIQHEALQQLAGSNADLAKLTILLIDERYGPVGHEDSNWQQLKDVGFFIDGPAYIDPYAEAETDLGQAVSRYEKVIDDILMSDSYLYAQLGMGDDGHVSGILPRSEATETTDHTVMGYECGGFQRLTTTFLMLERLHEVALVAFGENKWPKLAEIGAGATRSELPAEVLTSIAKVTVYTDYSK